MLLALLCPPARAAAPALYTYPAPYIMADGSLLPSLVTVAPEMATTQVPRIRDLAGVVLLVSWAQLCPTAQGCDLSLIDRTLGFWGRMGRQVVLGLSTMGPAIETVSAGQTWFAGETPSWVLGAVQTYTADMPTFGWAPSLPVDANGAAYWPTTIPDFADPRFMAAVAATVRQLGARYDGNPALSAVRVSLGSLDEDNPIPPQGAGLGALAAIPGYSLDVWLAYCTQMTALYRAAFPHTRLEVDIGVLADSYASVATPAQRVAIDQYLRSLAQTGTLVAFNGMGVPISWAAPSLAALQRIEGWGGTVGLEEYGPVSDPFMQNLPVIRQTMAAVRASRLVLFGIDTGTVQYHRRGPTPDNLTAQLWMAPQTITLQQAAGFDGAILRAAGLGDTP